MALSHLSPFMRAFLFGAFAISALIVIAPGNAGAQETTSRQDACRISKTLNRPRPFLGLTPTKQQERALKGQLFCARQSTRMEKLLM
jgi:hypothetical protein